MNAIAGKAEDAWRADPSPVSVPVCKPQLPSADRLLPYLREIDASRWYTNHGALSSRFEMRLADHVDAESSEQLVVACNATAALTATLLALDLAPGSFCMMPAWTFAASGHAVVQAGLVPWFVDVAEGDGALCAGTARTFIADAPRRPGAVLVVSPFGRPVDLRGWEDFRGDTGIPVVIDAAAGFDSVRAASIPTVVSMHATKVFGIGEGAFVVSTDTRRIRAVRQRINFGFAGSREAAVSGMNAKLSEYGAAVGLAALDDWPVTRAAFRRVALEYARAFRQVDGVRLPSGHGEDWISGTTIVETPPAARAHVEDSLARAGIGMRRWWGEGLARQRAFAGYPRSALPVTEALAERTLGLPCWPDLPPDAIERIAELVATGCVVAEEHA